MKLDILVLAAHPDDAELCCAGTILSHIDMGKLVGIIDLTQGEMGTRGTPEIRLQESKNAAKILGLSVRENLGFKDVYFENNIENQMEVVKVIRKYQPDIILTNSPSDRHPDHVRASELVEDACFKSGLVKVKTKLEGISQEACRPKSIYHFLQNWYHKPDIVVDVTPYWDKKIEAFMAYKSQFFDPESKEPDSIISSPEFLKLIEARSRELGYSIGVPHAEGFLSSREIGVKDLFQLI